ncbi:MAG: hypothetical protein PWP70_33 [Moorella sp. (in: firmicutes)]|nr:hypothetical protein [Moorella sp. (in: firmicutes)]
MEGNGYRQVCRYVKNEAGQVAVMVLIAISLFLLLAASYMVDHTWLVKDADVRAQGGLERAVKAAALQWSSGGSGEARPLLDEARARQAFCELLKENLGLECNPDDIAWLQNRPTATPVTLSAQPGAPLEGGRVLAFLVHNDYQPATFDHNNDPDIPDGVEFKFNEPGVVAVVEFTFKFKFMSGREVPFTRWAAAHLEYIQ